MTLIFLLALVAALVPYTLCCSCPEDAWRRPRDQAMREAFCSSRDVYLGTVVAVTCNCRPPAPQQGLYCQSYSVGQTANLVHERTLVLGAYTEDCLPPYYISACSEVASRVTPEGYTVENTTSTAPVEHVTDCYSLVCPFEPPMDRDWWYYSTDSLPCLYTIRIDATFKGNFQVEENITSTGPDVLTSCGWYGSALVLGAQYLQGVGQVCSPIAEWGSPSDYTQADWDYLTELSGDSLAACGGHLGDISTSEPLPSVTMTSLPPPVLLPTHKPTGTTLIIASQEPTGTTAITASQDAHSSSCPLAPSPTFTPLLRGGASPLLPSSLLALPAVLGLMNCL